jgi:agmatinase
MTVANNPVADKTKTFFALSREVVSLDEAKTVIIPVPYEATTTYGKGTVNGPAAILEASQQVELFDEELWVEPYKIGIVTEKALTVTPPTPESENPFSEITAVVKPLVERGTFPILLGGEQSIALGAVRACVEKYPDLSILHIDAHCDLRASFEGNPYSHACVAQQMYQALPNPKMVQAGIRNISWEEVAWLETEQPNVNIYWARQQDTWDYQEMIKNLTDNVYISLDLSSIDSGIMPATGNPEPGGLNWINLLKILKMVCIKRNVVAADITELSPISGFKAPDFLAARLIYKLIGYRYALELGVNKKYI